MEKFPWYKLILGLRKTKTFSLPALLMAAIIAYAEYKGFGALADPNTVAIAVSGLFTLIAGATRLVTSESVADKLKKAATQQIPNPFYENGGLAGYLKEHPEEFMQLYYWIMKEAKDRKQTGMGLLNVGVAHAMQPESARASHLPQVKPSPGQQGSVRLRLLIVMTAIWASLLGVFTFNAWSGSGTFGLTGANGYMEGRRYATMTVTGAASNNGTATLTTADTNVIKNHYIQEVITTPGTGAATPSEYTLVISDVYGHSISIPARSTTAVESYDVPGNLGRNWAVLGPLTAVATGLGEDNTVGIMILVH